jgi:phage tail protein X
MNRYQNILKTKIDGKEVYVTSRYPEVPLSESDIYVITTQGDRFDVLAQQYYQNSSLWWIISIANTGNAGAGTLVSLPQNSLVIPEGIQIRIPSNYADVIRNFNTINVY